MASSWMQLPISGHKAWSYIWLVTLFVLCQHKSIWTNSKNSIHHWLAVSCGVVVWITAGLWIMHGAPIDGHTHLSWLISAVFMPTDAIYRLENGGQSRPQYIKALPTAEIFWHYSGIAWWPNDIETVSVWLALRQEIQRLLMVSSPKRPDV